MGMTGMCRIAGVMLVAVLSLGATAKSQTAIVGTVLDNEHGHPLWGVSVTASSPSGRGEIRTKTDSDGAYRMDGVPPGTYSIRFEREAYKLRFQTGVKVSKGATVRVNVSLSETKPFLRALCRGHFIDMAQTPRMVSERDGVSGLALGRPRGPSGGLRGAEILAELSPATLLDPYGFSIRGASAFENGYLLEGFSTRDAVTGLNLAPLSMEFVSLVTAHAERSMPDLGRANGGVIETRLPWRCPRIHGTAFASWTPGGLEGARDPSPIPDSAGTGRGGLKNLGDFGLTLGGPLLPNRLSFFAGVVPAFSRIGRHDDLTDHRGVQAMGKLTYHVTHMQEASLVVLATPSFARGTDTVDRSWESENETLLALLDFSGVFLNRKLLFSAKAGWLNHKAVSRVSTGDEWEEQRRFQAKAEGLYLKSGLGTHVVKAGIDAEHSTYDQRPPRSFRAGSTLLGGFVQDSWTVIPSLMLQGGARYDVQSLKVGLDGRRALSTHLLSPRAVVVLTPQRMKGSRFFTTFSKYHDLLPLGLLDAGSGRSATIDPDLVPMSSREFSAGAWHAFRLRGDNGFWFNVDAQYIRRHLDAALASINSPDNDVVLIGNPGFGLAAALPRAVRTYDAVTVAVHPHLPSWRTRFSYTWSRLHGNQTEPFGIDAGRPLARQQLLPADRTHSIKATGRRSFELTDKLLLNTGVSYQGASETPRVDGEGRNPWFHVLDAHVDLNYHVSTSESVTSSLDALNLLNTQPGAWLGEGREVESDGTPPLYVLPPLQVRFGVRYAF